jgi:hypothetical protein
MKFEEYDYKIGIIGDIRYQDVLLIKETLFSIKNKFKDLNIVICSRGKKDGCDPLIKKYTLEFDLPYVEFNPFCTQYNCFSRFNSGKYDRPYGFRHIAAMNKIFIDSIDYLLVFHTKNDKTDQDVEQCAKYCLKIDKIIKVIN